LTSGRVAYARTLRHRSRIEIDISVAERTLRGELSSMSAIAA
jgi:hypothetical protein